MDICNECGISSHTYTCSKVIKCDECKQRLDIGYIVHLDNCSHVKKCNICGVRIDLRSILHGIGCPCRGENKVDLKDEVMWNYVRRNQLRR